MESCATFLETGFATGSLNWLQDKSMSLTPPPHFATVLLTDSRYYQFGQTRVNPMVLQKTYVSVVCECGMARAT